MVIHLCPTILESEKPAHGTVVLGMLKPNDAQNEKSVKIIIARVGLLSPKKRDRTTHRGY